MSAEVIKTGMSSELEKFKAGVTNTSPKLGARARVTDTGLFYVKKGQECGTVWKSNVDDLDGFQLKLNREGIRNISRAYRFEILPGGEIPFKTVQMNTMSMRMLGWDTSALRKGDEVDLYFWKNNEYVQYGYKKGE